MFDNFNCMCFFFFLGLMEICVGFFVFLLNNMFMLGIVGFLVLYVEVCLEFVFEMGYDVLLSEMFCGEICISGDILFLGYYKWEDLIKEVLVDGWFYMGIIGFCFSIFLVFDWMCLC